MSSTVRVWSIGVSGVSSCTGIFVNEMRRAFSTRSEAGASGEVLLKRRARSQVLIDARAYYDASLFQGFGSGASAFFGAPPTAPIGSQSYRLWSKLDDAKVNSSRRSTTFDNAIDAATEEPDDEADEDAVAARACMESAVAPQAHPISPVSHCTVPFAHMCTIGSHQMPGIARRCRRCSLPSA